MVRVPARKPWEAVAWKWSLKCNRDSKALEMPWPQDNHQGKAQAQSRVGQRERFSMPLMSELERQATVAFWSTDGPVTSPRCLTWSCRIWTCPCWILIFLWFNHSLVCLASFLLRWGHVFVYWNYGSYRWLWTALWTLRPEHGSFGETASAINCRAISSAPRSWLFK